MASSRSLSLNRTGEGVSLYIRKNVKYVKRSNLDIFDDYLESLFVEIDKQSVNCIKNIIIGVLYRPPNTDPDAFIQSLSPLLEKLDNENKTLYLMGDFNVNLLNADTHKFTADFVELMFSHYFMPLINKATRVTRNSTTLIDNIFCNDAHNTSLFNGIFYSDISDHFPVFSIKLSSTTAKDDCTILKGRNYSQSNVNKFKDKLQVIDWNDVMIENDCQKAFYKFYHTYLECFDECFPVRSYKSNYRNRKPWLSAALKTLSKQKTSCM